MVRLVYMTPSLEGLEGVDPNDEFENLEDLIRRSCHPERQRGILFANRVAWPRVSYARSLVRYRSSG